MKEFLLIVFLGFGLQLLYTPLFKKLAFLLNFVDKPNQRKLHTKITPLLGGLAIIFTFGTLLAIFFKASSDLNLKGLVVGGCLIALVGLYDDRFQLRWSLKLLAQLLITLGVMFFFNIRTSIIDNVFIDAAVTALWVTGLTNSLNLLDNMDGLAAGTAAIAAFFFSLLALKEGQYDLAIYSFCLFVSALSFLNYNFPPAEIFMGDTGSMFLGMNLGFIAVLLQVRSFSYWQLSHSEIFSQFTFLTALIPLLVLAVPLFDTFLVMILRPLNGIKISTPGKDHSSHRLTLVKGRTQRILDKLIILYIKTTKRKLKKENLSPNKAIAQTRAVLMLYITEIIFGVVALFIADLFLPEILLSGAFLLVLIFLAGRKLAEVEVYSK